MTFWRRNDSASLQLWQWYLGIGIFLIVLACVLPLSAISIAIYDTFSIGAACAMLWRSRDRNASGRRGWQVLTVGISVLAVGDLVGSVYRLRLGGAPAFPSLTDAFYLAAYPILLTGLVVLSLRRGRGNDRGIFLDAAIVGIGYGVTAWFIALKPYLGDDSYSLLSQFVSAAYPTLDILLFAAVALLLLTPGKRPPAYYLLVGGTLLYMGTDLIYARAVVSDTVGNWMFPVWMLGELCWGAAALHPTLSQITYSTNQRQLTLTRQRVVILTVTALAVPMLQLFDVAHGSRIDEYVSLTATCLIFLLVVLRFASLFRTITGSEHRFRSLVQHGADLITVIGPDMRIRYTSPSFQDVLGYDPDALLDREWLSIVKPHAQREVSATLAYLVAHPGTQRTIEVDVHHTDGSTRTLEATGSCLFHDADVGGLIVNAHDITIRKQSQEALYAAQMMSTSVIESSVDGIFAVDPALRITVWNRAMEQSTGLTRDLVLGQPMLDLFPFLMTTGEDALIQAALEGHSNLAPIQPNLVAETGKAGFYEARYAPLTDAAGAVVGVIGVVRDVTAQKALEAELQHHAFHDALTNLPNRILFADRLEHALAIGSRRGKPTAVLLLDLDRFKLVNDSLGHAAGDQLLLAVANRLSHHVRDADTLARLGGDEFVIVLEETSLTVAWAIGERILNALKEPFIINGREVFAGTSIGIALSTPERNEPEELLRGADVALYRAKAAGRQTIIAFDPTTNDPTAGWLALEADLRRAVSRNEFVLHYQPVVDLDSGQVVTVEALSRWNHPTRGLLAPHIFIPLAEETGLITDITWWALREACRQLAIWSREYQRCAPPMININVTTRDLRHPALVERVTNALAAAGLPPSALCLEITERILVEELREAEGALGTLRALGVHLAIDDFGAGASSLASLRAVDAKMLKLDRAFVRGLDDNLDDRIVVEAVTAMAHALGIAVTAEGIESPSQRTLALAAGCDRGQGFLFARPLPADELTTWLIRRDLPSDLGGLHLIFDHPRDCDTAQKPLTNRCNHIRSSN